MKEYFKLTGRKILGIIILLFLFSFINFFFQFASNSTGYVTGQNSIAIGFPLVYYTVSENLNILNLIIDIIIFYFVTCILAMIFRRKKENVPISNSGGGSTSPPNQAQS